MGTIVREANLQTDGETIRECLRRFLTPRADLPRYHWLYRDNPQGQVRAWLAIDQPTNTVIGSAAAFPRRLYDRGGEVEAWVLGDFCIDDRYRVLGPALTLQRSMFAALESSGKSFCYDFPGEKMVAIYKRMRMEPTGRMVRMARAVRVDRIVTEYVRFPIAATGISALGNWVLGTTLRAPKFSSAIEFAVVDGKCGAEFSQLCEKIGDRHGACVKRSAAYLNWRYLDNPYCAYSLMTARRGGALAAYAVFGRGEDDGVIADLFGEADGEILSGLLHRVVKNLRDQGVLTVSCELFESHPWLSWVEAAGFRPRETKPLIAYNLREKAATEPGGARGWFMMHGDRDS